MLSNRLKKRLVLFVISIEPYGGQHESIGVRMHIDIIMETKLVFELLA